MRLTIAVALLLAAATTTLHAQSRSYTIAKGGNNVASFHAEDTYDAFDGKTSDVSGTIVADPANPAASSVQIVINVDSLDTGVGMRNKEMRERYLETTKFGTATFKSISVVAKVKFMITYVPPTAAMSGHFVITSANQRFGKFTRTARVRRGSTI